MILFIRYKISPVLTKIFSIVIFMKNVFEVFFDIFVFEKYFKLQTIFFYGMQCDMVSIII